MWELAEREEGLNKLINEAMASDTQLVMPAFIRACTGVLQDVRSMVDVGGGTGAAMRAVAEAFPWIKCTTFDLPHVVQAAVECNRVSLVAGNMFDRIIPSCDAVLLKVDIIISMNIHPFYLLFYSPNHNQLIKLTCRNPNIICIIFRCEVLLIKKKKLLKQFL